MLGRRIGKFYISQRHVESEEMIIILRELKFIPYRVECLFYKGEFEYIGYSPLFEIIEVGEEVPLYRIDVYRQDNGQINVEAKIKGLRYKGENIDFNI